MLKHPAQPRRVLLLAYALDAGGSERQLAETAKALFKSGWDVHVGCFHDDGIRAQELRSLGIAVVRFAVTSFASASAFAGMMSFRRYVAHHRIELTHSFDMPMTIFSALGGRFSACRTILSSQRSYRDLLTPLYHRLLRVTDKLVDGVVVNCQAIREHLIQDEGVRPERIHLCYNGLDTNMFYPAPATGSHGRNDDAVVIGCVAVLRPEKGLLTLIEAFARVHQEYPQTKLIIVGSGPLRNSLEQTAQTLNVAAHVQFEPKTANVAAWMNKMDIFVLPSTSEALSNSLMEAMACGVAPIASQVGGNPELVREDETGLLFPSGDSAQLASQIRRLVSDHALRHRLATAACKFIQQKMTIETASARMADIYSQVLGTNASSKQVASR